MMTQKNRLDYFLEFECEWQHFRMSKPQESITFCQTSFSGGSQTSLGFILGHICLNMPSVLVQRGLSGLRWEQLQIFLKVLLSKCWKVQRGPTCGGFDVQEVSIDTKASVPPPDSTVVIFYRWHLLTTDHECGLTVIFTSIYQLAMICNH